MAGIFGHAMLSTSRMALEQVEMIQRSRGFPASASSGNEHGLS